MSNFLTDNKAAMLRYAEHVTEMTNDYQTIKAFMSARAGDIKLSAKQQEKMKRWQFVYDQLSSGKFTEKEVRQQLMVHFNIEEPTAYRDIQESQELMATTLSINKIFKINCDIQLIEVLQRKANETHQLEAYAKLQKVKNELYKMLPDKEENPGDYFTPRQNIIDFNPALLGVAPVPEDQMKALFDQLKNEFGIIDVEYVDLPKDAANTGTL